MPDLALRPLRASPFAHVQAEQWLDAALYGELAATFPACPRETGPTGYTLFSGDPSYDDLIASNEAWRTFVAGFHQDAFVAYAIAQFADVFSDQAVVDLSHAHYVPYRESRRDKERRHLAVVDHAADSLWVRVDLLQGHVGYGRAPHVDHRRRAVSMLIYLCDADENEMVGGDLVLHGPGGATSTVRPCHNRMVMFPCHNASIHSVSPIVSQTRPRNFVQVTVSSSVDLWAPVAVPDDAAPAAGRRLRSLVRRVAARF